MGRSDIGLLNVPEKQRVPAGKPELPAEPPKEEEVHTEPKAVEKPQLENCPHCGAHLSPLDIKMNKCFKCWAILDAETPQTARQGRTRFEVHI